MEAVDEIRIGPAYEDVVPKVGRDRSNK